jgi:hypothetical protein
MRPKTKKYGVADCLDSGETIAVYLDAGKITAT